MRAIFGLGGGWLALVRRILIPLAGIMIGAAAQASVVTWGQLGLNDDANSHFIASVTSSQSGANNEVYDILLPDFSASNFSTFSSGRQLAFSLSASAGGTLITGFFYEIFGAFGDLDSFATYDFNSATASGNATASLTTGLLSLVPGTSQDVAGIFNLFELGGLTSISEIRLTAELSDAGEVPEPGSLPLIALGLLVFLALGCHEIKRRGRAAATLALGIALGFCAIVPAAAQTSTTAKVGVTKKNLTSSLMSPMGARASNLRRQIAKIIAGGKRGTFSLTADAGGDTGEECDDCNSDPDFTFPGGGSNAEIRVAVDPTGQNVIVGFNDSRGFSFSPVTLSGVARSSDGGLTWVDGGRLPNGPTTTVGGSAFPQVFGDPDVKWVAGGTGCNFVYSSIMVKAISAVGTAQTLSMHTTTNCGVTWSNPIEVTPATNPTGVLVGSNARDAADKEFIDVDPDTGRVLISWTNFTVGAEIRVAYSDNLFSAAPTWSAGVIVSPAGFPGTASVQGSMPRFAGNGSPNAYLTWEQVSTATDPSGYNKFNVGFSRSTDNGVTWSAPVSLTLAAQQPDQIPGNDRIHSFPSIAVDNSSGANQGAIYITYVSNASGDGGNVMFQRSTDGGLSFTAPVSLSPRPGSDRSQWFPTIAVDKSSGRVSVIYYDQSVASTGDLTQATWVYSDNGGFNWSSPSRVCAPPAGIGATNACDRAFRAGFGNDTSQPNLGDYIGADAVLGGLYTSFAGTPKIVSYTDGQPSSGSMTTPEVRFKKMVTASPSLDIGTITLVDSGGNGYIDAGDTVKMIVPLTNFVTNPATSPVTYSSVSGTLSTTTAGVTLLRPTASYSSIAPGATVANALEYVFQVSPSYAPGTPIDFKLAISTQQGSGSMAFYRNTGTPVATTIFAENFDGVAPGILPSGWSSVHGGGTNTVPWTTKNTFCNTTGNNGLFHANANDATNPTRFERAFSPSVTVPANAAYVTLEFDTCYDTEDDPSYNVLAYDGLMLRITDLTAGRVLRSVLVEAFAEEFTTGLANHLPKHLPRNSSSAYLQDLSAWAGYSNGVKPVKLRLPGMQGSTVQMRWEYTQDSGGTCADIRPGHSCGVLVDNIVMKSVTLKSDELASLSLVPVAGVLGKYTATVKAQPIAGAGGIAVTLTSSNPGITTMPASVTVPAGAQTSSPFTVTISPAVSGTSVSIYASGPSNTRIAGIRLP